MLSSDDQALAYYARRDLLQEKVDAFHIIWKQSEGLKILEKQQPDGSWRYPAHKTKNDSPTNYSLLETYRQLGILVDVYELNREHPGIQKAAEYIFSCQSEAGDIRGILGNQYMPYYHGIILELLIKAGYEDDPRIIKALQWLLNVRQEDGGWIVPAQAVPAKEKNDRFWRSAPLAPDRNLPSSHLATGMALRAFAVHPTYRGHQAALTTAKLLKKRFFLADRYHDRQAPEYWLKFQYPFWWSNLLTAMDSLGRMGFTIDDPDAYRGYQWFIDHQEADGLWNTGYGKGKKAQRQRLWVGLAICRMVKRFGNNQWSEMR